MSFNKINEQDIPEEQRDAVFKGILEQSEQEFDIKREKMSHETEVLSKWWYQKKIYKFILKPSENTLVAILAQGHNGGGRLCL